LHLWQFALLGAGGGVIVETLAVFRYLAAWQRARKDESGVMLEKPPRLRTYLDVLAHPVLLVMRALLGAMSASIFAASGELKGPYVAIALGFCGPKMLERLGEIPQIREAVLGDKREPDSSDEDV
jgi:hypothetical protein